MERVVNSKRNGLEAKKMKMMEVVLIHCVTNEESTTIMDFNPRSMKEIETKGVEVKAKQSKEGVGVKM